MAVRSMRKNGWAALVGQVAVASSMIMCTGAAWGQWEQTHKLTAGDAAEDDQFGRAVAIHGPWAIVGAPYNDWGGYYSCGAAYLINAETGEQVVKIKAPDPAGHDYFGCAVAMDDELAIIGAYWDDYAAEDAGAAYLFDVATGGYYSQFAADDTDDWDDFGQAVGISGDVAIVGAPKAESKGRAYLFDVTDPANPVQTHKLSPDDEYPVQFGRAVAIDGGVAIVGVPNDKEMGTSAGAAYLFDVATGQKLYKLTADDAGHGEVFGYSVAISGDVAIIGAYTSGGFDEGSAYLFDVTTGLQLHKLIADDADGYDGFGFSVAIDGDVAIVGSWHDEDAAYDAGSAYLFDVATGDQLQKITADDAQAYDEFGFAAGISGSVAIVGARYEDDPGDNSGSAYLFEGSAAPCPADLNDDDMVNIDDLFAVLAAWGDCDSCPEDINDDGVVDIDDLFAVLAAWGPCP